MARKITIKSGKCVGQSNFPLDKFCQYLTGAGRRARTRRRTCAGGAAGAGGAGGATGTGGAGGATGTGGAAGKNGAGAGKNGAGAGRNSGGAGANAGGGGGGVASDGGGIYYFKKFHKKSTNF